MTTETTTQTEFNATLTAIFTKLQKELFNKSSLFANMSEETAHKVIEDSEKFVRLTKKKENKIPLIPTVEIVEVIQWLLQNERESIMQYFDFGQDTKFGFSRIALLTRSEQETHRKKFTETQRFWEEVFEEKMTGEMSEYSTLDNSFIAHHRGAL